MSGSIEPPEVQGTQAATRMPLAVVVERRATGNAWQPFDWRTVAVLPEESADLPWRQVAAGPGWERFAAGSLSVELFPGETAGYRETLASRQPVVFVVLRKKDAGDGVRPLLATVCPYEAQCYLESGEEIVDGVPMPPVLQAWVAAFVEAHPVAPFLKRQRQQRRREGEDCFRPFRRCGDD